MFSPLQETYLWLEEKADGWRDERIEEMEGLERKLKCLEALLRRKQVEKAQAIARKRAEEAKKKEEKLLSTPPST